MKTGQQDQLVSKMLVLLVIHLFYLCIVLSFSVKYKYLYIFDSLEQELENVMILILQT